MKSSTAPVALLMVTVGLSLFSLSAMAADTPANQTMRANTAKIVAAIKQAHKGPIINGCYRATVNLPAGSVRKSTFGRAMRQVQRDVKLKVMNHTGVNVKINSAYPRTGKWYRTCLKMVGSGNAATGFGFQQCNKKGHSKAAS